MSIKKETSQVIPQLIVIPAIEWESLKHEINSLKVSFGNNANQTLGGWLNENQTQQLLGRKATSLWRLRTNGVIFSKKIGGRNYYSKQSIIDFLECKK
ncbi:MAG TPA: helix-turn-helix domain-containing protein [Bacteroidia bacterium]|jgi:hypothetical protein|nr:helix-turn-helix domain-containing protein [Bacteroidia bacterium]